MPVVGALAAIIAVLSAGCWRPPVPDLLLEIYRGEGWARFGAADRERRFLLHWLAITRRQLARCAACACRRYRRLME